MKVNKEELSILVIEKESIDTYIDFIELIKKTMPKKEYLGDFTKKELIKLLEKKSYIYLFKLNNIIVASSMIIPLEKKEDFLIEKDDIKGMEIGPQTVFPDVRGNKIQEYMIERMEKISKSLGYNFLVTTVHPNNKYSIDNFLNRGFQYVGNKEYKRGIRNIYCKDI